MKLIFKKEKQVEPVSEINVENVLKRCIGDMTIATKKKDQRKIKNIEKGT